MLPLLALGAVALQMREDAPFPVESPDAVAEGLGTMGCRFIAMNDSGVYGKLTYNGQTVDAFLSGYESSRGTIPAKPVQGIQFTIELAFSREIPLDPESTDRYMPPGDKAALFTPHLGKTVTAKGWIDFRRASTLGQVRRELERFWREGGTYAEAHRGVFAEAPPQNWERTKFPDDTILRVADETSLERLTASWGWTYKKGWGGSTAGWFFPIDVEGTEIHIGQGFRDGFLPNTYFNIGYYVDLPASVDAKEWIETKGKRISWAEFSDSVGGPHRIYPRVVFDLRDGIPLGELRRRIREFAVGLAQLEKSFGTTPRSS